MAENNTIEGGDSVDARLVKTESGVSEDDLRFLMDVMGSDMREVAKAGGIEVTLKIMAALGGNSIYIPFLEDLQRALRDEEIRRGYAAGVSVRSLSMRYGLSSRTVYKVLKQPPAGISGWLEALIGGHLRNRASS